MPVWATFRFYVDWDGDGGFTGDDELTDYVLEADWELGRDAGSELVARGSAGKCRILLDNRTGRFSDFNAGSPLFGKALPGRRVQVAMTYGGNTVAKWSGRLVSVVNIPTELPQLAQVELRASGIFETLQQGKKIRIPYQENKTGKELLDLIASAAGWSLGETSFDTGMTTFQRFWTEGEISPLEAARLVEETEAGFLREMQNGNWGFEDRIHRYNPPHDVSQATYSNSMTADIRYSRIDPEGIATQNVFNHVDAKARTFDVTEEKLLVSLIDIYATSGQYGKPLPIPAGESIVVEIPYPGPATSTDELAVKDWTLTVYNANTQEDGEGADATADVDAAQVETSNKLTVTFTNTGGVLAYLTVCQAWGIAVIEGPPISVASDDADPDNAESIERYGYRPYPFPGQFICEKDEAQAFCDFIVSLYRNPNRAVTLELEGNVRAEHMQEIYDRDISDSITIVGDSKTSLYLNTDFFIERLAYEFRNNGIIKMRLTCHVKAGIEWGEYFKNRPPGTVTPPPTGVSPHVPDDLYTNAISAGLDLMFAAVAEKWNEDIDEAEFRAIYAEYSPGEYVDLRTPAEGGTFVHNGVDQLIVTGYKAWWWGVHFQWLSHAQGRWYFAFRLHNTEGWSVWTDGNDVPSHVTDYLDTEDPSHADDAPPSDWSVEVIAGPLSNTAQIVASRPALHAAKILFAFFQLRDASVGLWRDIAEDGGAAEVWYDGHEVMHIFNKPNGTLEIDEFYPGYPGSYGAEVEANGGLVLFDPRGSASAWTSGDWTMWGTIAPQQVSGRTIEGMGGFRPIGTPDGLGNYDDIKVMIVKPPWSWVTEGYLGGVQGMGMYSVPDLWKNGGDKLTQRFISEPIAYPTNVAFTQLQGRVWFANSLYFSDDDTVSPYPGAYPGSMDPGVIILHEDTTITIDCSLGSIFWLYITMDVHLNPLKNPRHGTPVILVVQQDTVGGHRLDFDDSFVTGIDIDDLALSGAAKSRDYYGFIHNKDYNCTDVVALVRGYLYPE